MTNITWAFGEAFNIKKAYIYNKVSNAAYAFYRSYSLTDLVWEGRNCSNNSYQALYGATSELLNITITGNAFNMYSSIGTYGAYYFDTVKMIDLSGANNCADAFANTQNASHYYTFKGNPTIIINEQCPNMANMFARSQGLNGTRTVNWKLECTNFNYAFCVNKAASSLQFAGNIAFNKNINLYRCFPWRDSTAPRLNIFVRRGSTLDTIVSGCVGTGANMQWFCNGVTNSTSTVNAGVGQLVDNGFYFPTRNLYVYNNLA